ncbi:uncharacterized protein LACBIDRAFT_296029, partial [Laccaria bicolor S238N-H82]
MFHSKGMTERSRCRRSLTCICLMNLTHRWIVVLTSKWMSNPNVTLNQSFTIYESRYLGWLTRKSSSLTLWTSKHYDFTSDYSGSYISLIH